MNPLIAMALIGSQLMTSVPQERWQLETPHAIVWHVSRDNRLPHEDHLEMSGLNVSLIVRYHVDEKRHLVLSREVVWPMLRIKPKDVRGYLIRTFGEEAEPQILVDNQPVAPGPVTDVRYDGDTLVFTHEPLQGVQITRGIEPSTGTREVVETWTVRNMSGHMAIVRQQPAKHEEETAGMYGTYHIAAQAGNLTEKRVLNGATGNFYYRYSADIKGQNFVTKTRTRGQLVRDIRSALILETPDPVLNQAFEFAKIRAVDSIFQTKRGPVHSPGGGRYYGGVWANDQAEYANPFFPFVGYRLANAAASTAYDQWINFLDQTKGDFAKFLPSSFEMECDIEYHAGGDRGDAAMVAYGASRFALALSDVKEAQRLWPLISWALEYCDRKTTKDGVVASDTDELEGRFPTGKANLSTSSLAYGAYQAASNLARELGYVAKSAEWAQRAVALRAAINRYFGGKVEGFDTYKYYASNKTLRAWICLPLVMGMTERKEGTIAALFSPRLWTQDGLATEAGGNVFWDRSTLYALRGVFAAGETETGLRYLTDYTHRRLLGEHVPYPVEAYPEGGQAHLSAESALYCRIFTEGLFGINPSGLRTFTVTPRLPKEWNRMALRSIRAFGNGFDMVVTRRSAGFNVTITRAGVTVFDSTQPEGAVFTVRL